MRLCVYVCTADIRGSSQGRQCHCTSDSGAKHKLAHSICTLAIEIILSFRSPYFVHCNSALRALFQLQYPERK